MTQILSKSPPNAASSRVWTVASLMCSLIACDYINNPKSKDRSCGSLGSGCEGKKRGAGAGEGHTCLSSGICIFHIASMSAVETVAKGDLSPALSPKNAMTAIPREISGHIKNLMFNNSTKIKVLWNH